MQHFLLKILIFGVVFTGLTYGLDYVIQEGIKTTNYNEVGKWDELVKGGIDADELIVGSSRALVHFDVEKMGEYNGKTGYNLGFNGFTFPHMKKTLELYLDRNFPPKKITWVIDYHTFESKDSFYGFEQLIPYQEDPKAGAILNLAYKNSWAYSIPMYRYSFNRALKLRGLMGYFKLFKRKQVLRSGFLPQDRSWDGNFDSLLQQNPKGVSLKFEEELFQEFSDLNKYLLNQGIGLEWIIAPYLEEYNQLLVNREEILQRISSQAKILDIPFYDYSSSEVSPSRDYFYNASHLNQKGVDWWMGEISEN